MQALRVELGGVTTSFRFPHFLVGRQPSYPLPPPATIYGHICSALGEYADPRALRFAYTFTTEGVGDDLEHQQIMSVSTGRMPNFPGLPKNVEGGVQPVGRQVFLSPRLVLYLDAPGQLIELMQAFREPRYPVVLGRSQDLASYRSVQIVEIISGIGYAEGTLLTLDYLETEAASTAQHFLMPRYVDPEDRRRVEWQPYLALVSRANLPAEREGSWIDPESPEWKEHRRAVIWHGFVGGD